MCIYAQRDCDTILFHHEGGVEIGDVDSKVKGVNMFCAISNHCHSVCVQFQSCKNAGIPLRAGYKNQTNMPGTRKCLNLANTMVTHNFIVR